MGLREDFLAILEEEEEKALAPPVSPVAKLFEDQDVKSTEQLFDPDDLPLKGALYNTIGRGLWAALDEAAFHAPETILKKGYDTELFDEPEGIVEKGASAIGSLVGFIGGAPMKVGAKVARTIAKPFIKKAGGRALDDVIATGVKGSKGIGKTLETGSGLRLEKGINQISNEIPGWVKKASWNKNLADDWGKWSTKNLDDSLTSMVDRKIIRETEANILRDQFGKALAEGRPMQDFMDLFMRSSMFSDPKKAFAVGAMMHEALMFGAIDSIFEGARSYTDGREYDMFAPIWGIGTGAAFGTLKFLPKAGKGSSGRKDFVQGLRSTIGGRDRAIKNMSDDQLIHTAKHLGDDLKYTYGEKAGRHIASYTHKGQNYDIDLTDIGSYLELNHVSKEWPTIIKKALSAKQAEIGSEMMSWARKESFTHITENWMHMVGGTLFMNARTILDLTRGNDVPAEDILLNVLLGAYLNRRGAPRVYDYTDTVKRMRSQLDILGVGSKNYYNRIPTFGNGPTNPLNPLHHPIFEKVNKNVDEIAKSEVYGETESLLPRGEVSSMTSNADLSLFNSFYDYATGTKGKRYIRPKDQISEVQAKSIENMLKEVKVDGKKIETKWDFEEAMQTISNQMNDALTVKLGNHTYETFKDIAQMPIPEAPNEFKALPRGVEIPQKFLDLAEQGKLKWLIGTDQKTLSGPEAKAALISYRRKASELLKFHKIMPNNELSKDAAVVKDEVQLQEFVRKLLAIESSINRGFKVNTNKGYKFKLEDLTELGMAMPMIQRKFRVSIDNFNSALDRKNQEQFPKLMNILVSHKILQEDLNIESGYRMPKDPFNQIKIKESDGVGTEQMYNAKKFLANILQILGSKRQIDTDLHRGEFKVNYSSIKEIQDFLKKNNLVSDMNTVNSFAKDIIMRNTLELNKKSSLTFDHVGWIQTAMEQGMAWHGAKGVVQGFELAKIPDSPGANHYNRKNINDHNKMVDIVMEAGKVYDKNNAVIAENIKTTREIRPMTESQLESLGDNARRFMNGNSPRATEWMADVINHINMTDVPLRESLIEIYNKYEKLVPEIRAWFLNKGVMVVDKNGMKKDGLVRYTYHTDVLAQETPLRVEFEKWLRTSQNVDIDHIAALRTDANQKINDVVSQNFHSEGNSLKSQQEFFSTYWPVSVEKNTNTLKNETYMDVEYQNKLLEKAIYKGIDKRFDKRATVNIIEQMDAVVVNKKSGETLTGKEFIEQVRFETNRIGASQDNAYLTKFRDIKADVLNVIKQKVEGRKVEVLSLKSGKMNKDYQIKARTPLDDLFEKLKIDYFYVDGTMEVYEDFAGRPFMQYKNIFEAEASQLTSAQQQNYNRSKLWFHQQVDRIMFGEKGVKQVVSDPFGTNIREIDTGVAYIRVGNGKNTIGIKKSDAHIVVNEWFKQVYDPFYKKADSKTQRSLSAIKESITLGGKPNNPDAVKNGKSPRFDAGDIAWSRKEGTAMDLALLQVVLKHQLTGTKETSLFKKSWGWKPEEVLSNISKRFTLYDSKRFYKMSDPLIKAATEAAKVSLDARDISTMEIYSKRDINHVIWNDKKFGTIADRLNEMGLSFEKLSDMRENKSGFDSISFMSNNYRNLQNILSSAGAEQQTTFKSLASSQGETSILFYNKTAYIFSPIMQEKFFSKHRKLDVLTTLTADKMNSIPESMYINKTPKEMLDMSGAEIERHMFSIKKDAIAIKGFEKHKEASNSYSLFAFLSAAESRDVYNGIYGKNIDWTLQTLQSAAVEPHEMNALIRSVRKVDPEMTVEVLENLQTGDTGGTKAIGRLNKLAAIDPNARFQILGDEMIWNILKQKFIDPALNLKSNIRGKEDSSYGGKTVLTQDFFDRDLNPTTIHKTGGSYGDARLPYEAGQKLVSVDPNIKVKIAGKDQVLQDAYSVYKRLMKEKNQNKTDKEIQHEWEKINFDELNAFVKSMDPDLDVMGIFARYPRTRPNDLALLRIKGFLSKEHGNQAHVNDFDVYSIFEGDYDIDKVDYFMGHSEATFSNIRRMKSNWVSNAPVEQIYEKNLPSGFTIMPDFDKVNTTMHEWNKVDANNRIMEKNIGKVQKTLRSVEWLWNNVASRKVDPIKGKRLLQFRGPNGEDIEIYMDLGQKWYHRFAMEAQGLIDYFQPVKESITTPAKTAMARFLNPPEYMGGEAPGQKYSYTSKELMDSNFGFETSTSMSQNNVPRMRLFQKFVDGKAAPEGQLNAVDFRAVELLLQHYGSFAQLSTKLYSPGNPGRTANYKDMMEVSKNYFTGLGKIDEILGHQLASEFAYKGNKNSEYVKAMYELEPVLYDKAKSSLLNPNDKSVTFSKIQVDPQTYHYWKRKDGKSIFDDGTFINLEQISLGERGSVVERAYKKILDADPMNWNRTNKEYLTGDQRAHLDYISTLLQSQSDWATDQMQAAIPRAFKGAKDMLSSVLYLKRKAYYLENNYKIPGPVKERRLKGIKRAIERMESNLGDIIPKNASFKTLDKLSKVKLSNVHSNAEVREGTKQLYTMWHFYDNLGQSGSQKMWDRISNLRKLSRMYGEFFNLGESQNYGHMTIQQRSQVERSKNPIPESSVIEDAITKEIIEGVNAHGTGFLPLLAMPRQTDMSWGVFNNEAIPTALGPSKFFKRVIRFAIDSQTMDPTLFKDGKVTQGKILEFLKEVLYRDNYYSNMFEGHYRYLPTNPEQLHQSLSSIPSMSQGFKRFIGRRYGSFEFRQHAFENHIFGLTKEYKDSISLYRTLQEVYGGDDTAYNHVTQGLSKLHEVSMQAGYVDPISYTLLVDNFRTELQSLGIVDAIKHGRTVTGKEVRGNEIFKNDPLVTMIQDIDGYSLDPLKLIRPYKLEQLKKFLRNAGTVASTPKGGTNKIKEIAERWQYNCNVPTVD